MIDVVKNKNTGPVNLAAQYELWDTAWNCSDVLECAEKLADFANVALKSEHRTKLCQLVKRDMTYATTLISPLFDAKSPYAFYVEYNALKVFLLLNVHERTPVKMLNNILELANSIKKEFLPPSGKCISESFIKDAVAFLNDKYSFFNKVYGRKPVFILLNNSNVSFNSICLTKGEYFFVILYHMRHDVEDEVVPEYVFLHELGHALQTKLTGSIFAPPESFTSYFRKISPKPVSELELCEVFADFFAIAVMQYNQFSKYDPFIDIGPERKVMCLEYIEKLINQM